MIISASRRTDIPAFYTPWLLKRMQEGFVLVRNPMNPRQVSRIRLSQETVDGFVFWTKNPIPMLQSLSVFDPYAYYFQFTLTAYGRDIEPGLPDKERELIPAFCRLSDRIGPDRVIWRYDPILLNDRYTMEEHAQRFERICRRLQSYTRKCTISFMDLYGKTKRHMQGCALSLEEQERMAKTLAEIAHSYGLAMDTCAEGIDLSRYGIGHAKCVDGQLFEKLLGCPVKQSKDPNQRPACGCMESVDIGAYNTCANGCAYCYANANAQQAAERMKSHDSSAALLAGPLSPEDRVTDRKMPSLASRQIAFEL